MGALNFGAVERIFIGRVDPVRGIQDFGENLLHTGNAGKIEDPIEGGAAIGRVIENACQEGLELISAVSPGVGSQHVVGGGLKLIDGVSAIDMREKSPRGWPVIGRKRPFLDARGQDFESMTPLGDRFSAAIPAESK